jgi:hypothetical protein
MSEERRAVIEAALPDILAMYDYAAMADHLDKRLAEWERSREPTDTELDAAAGSIRDSFAERQLK